MTEVRITLSELHPKQLEVEQNCARFNVMEMGRRFGKTLFGINKICETAIDGFPAAWFAPTNKYLREPWETIKKILAPITLHVNSQERRIELITGGVIDFWSLEDQDAGRGKKYKRVVVDEGGMTRNLQVWWTEAGRPTLTDLKGDAWFLGTPKGRQYFHKLFAKGQQGDPGWKSWRFGTADNPYIDRAEIEDARKDYEAAGLIHIFNQEYLGIPADDGGNPFGIDAIARCIIPQLSTKPTAVFGVDLAKSQDFTWIVGLDADGNMTFSSRMQCNWEQTTHRVVDAIKYCPVAIDATGVGDPVVEMIRRELGVNVDDEQITGYTFTNSSKQQLMELLATSIQRQQIGIHPGLNDVLRNELESFEYEVRPGGSVRYSAPDGLHDDGVCALALATWKLRQFIPFSFARGNIRDSVEVGDKYVGREKNRSGWDDNAMQRFLS